MKKCEYCHEYVEEELIYDHYTIDCNAIDVEDLIDLYMDDNNPTIH